MKLKVLGARVVVRPDELKNESPDSSLVLTDRHHNREIFTGTIVAIGQAPCPECGHQILDMPSVGDRVGYEPHGGQLITVGTESVLMLWIEDLLFVAEAKTDVA